MTGKETKFIDRLLALQNELTETIENGNCTEQRKAIKRLHILILCLTVAQPFNSSRKQGRTELFLADNYMNNIITYPKK